MRTPRAASALIVALVIVAAPPPRNAEAQNDTDVPRGRFHIGALRFAPRFALSEAGLDDNVFRDAHGPRGDMTFTATPGLAMAARLGRVSFVGSSDLVYRHFHAFASERSLTSRHTLEGAIPFSRLRAGGSVAWMNTTEQPTLEVAQRARRRAWEATLDVDYHLSARTSLRAAVQAHRTMFASQVSGTDPGFANAFDRRRTTARLGVAHAITPLTTIVFETQRREDRFDWRPEQDAVGLRLLSGVELQAPAFISGRVLVGYRRDAPRHAGFSRMAGVAVDARVTTVVNGTTRIVVSAVRDIEYALSAESPYLLDTRVAVQLTRRLVDDWEASAAGLWERLSPQAAVGLDKATSAAQRLSGTTLRVGLARVLPSGIRLGFEAVRMQRRSADGRRNFRVLQAGTMVRYGF